MAATDGFTVKEILLELRGLVAGLAEQVVRLETRIALLEQAAKHDADVRMSRSEYRRWLIPVGVSVVMTLVSAPWWR